MSAYAFHPHDLAEQVATFKQYFSPAPKKLAWDPDTTLFSFFFGKLPLSSPPLLERRVDLKCCTFFLA
jgi:hypothetical protein